MSGRDPVHTLAWVCIGLGLAIAVLGSGYVVLENRALGTPPRMAWTPPRERNDELPVWPFFYSGTAVVAYGVLLLIIDRRDHDDGCAEAEGVSPRGTRAD